MADVRENVHEHAARVGRADCIGRLHVLAALVLEIFAADQPESARPAGQPQDQHDSERPLLLQHGGNGEDQQQVRDRREHAVEPVEEIVEPLAVVAGDGAKHRAEQRGHARCGESDEDRRFRALDHLLQHVTAPLVATQRQRRGSRFCSNILDRLAPDVRHHFGERIYGLVVLRDRGFRGLRRRGTFVADRGERIGERILDRQLGWLVGSAGRGRRARRAGRGLGGPDERRRRVVDPDLFRPVFRDEPRSRQHHHHQEHRNDRQRDHRDAIGAQPLPRQRP